LCEDISGEEAAWKTRDHSIYIGSLFYLTHTVFTSDCYSSLPRVGVHSFHSDSTVNIRFLLRTYKRCWKRFSSVREHLLLYTFTFASLLIRVNFPQLGTDLCPRSSSMCVKVRISEWQKMGIGLDLRFYHIPYHREYA
jgi:hypothetical protein